MKNLRRNRIARLRRKAAREGYVLCIQRQKQIIEQYGECFLLNQSNVLEAFGSLEAIEEQFSDK